MNATPLGLNPGDPLPFRPDLLPSGSVVADIKHWSHDGWRVVVVTEG